MPKFLRDGTPPPVVAKESKIFLGRRAADASLARRIREITLDGEVLAQFAIGILAGRGVELEDGTKEMPRMRDMRWAVEWLSDRGFGKAHESYDVNISDGPAGVSELSDGELQEAVLRNIEREKAARRALSETATILGVFPGPRPDGVHPAVEQEVYEADASEAADPGDGGSGKEGAGE